MKYKSTATLSMYFWWNVLTPKHFSQSSYFISTGNSYYRNAFCHLTFCLSMYCFSQFCNYWIILEHCLHYYAHKLSELFTGSILCFRDKCSRYIFFIQTIWIKWPLRLKINNGNIGYYFMNAEKNFLWYYFDMFFNNCAANI